MRYAIALLLLLVAPSCSSQKVDPALVGTWELNVPNTDGVARWVWDIHPEGTYAFHAEGPGGVPAHSGTFEAKNGKYSLRSTTIAWVDDGTYQVIQGNTLSATGKLGTASWTHAQPAQGQAPPDSAATHSASASSDSNAKPPEGSAKTYAPEGIYDYMSRHTFDDRILEAPLKATHTVTVDPDAQQEREGVIGIVRAEVQGSISPATISFVVYRDRAAAEAARDFYAFYDSKTFRIARGEMVASHAYSYKERGEARCLSRLFPNSSTRATVTCYLLVQYPTRDPVMIESEVSTKIPAQGEAVSMAAVKAADDLLLAGIKEWALIYPAIGGAAPR